MTSVSDFYNKTRRVRMIYNGDELVPRGTPGATEGLPFIYNQIECIRIHFDNGKSFSIALNDIEWDN